MSSPTRYDLTFQGSPANNLHISNFSSFSYTHMSHCMKHIAGVPFSIPSRTHTRTHTHTLMSHCMKHVASVPYSIPSRTHTHAHTHAHVPLHETRSRCSFPVCLHDHAPLQLTIRFAKHTYTHTCTHAHTQGLTSEAVAPLTAKLPLELRTKVGEFLRSMFKVCA